MGAASGAGISALVSAAFASTGATHLSNSDIPAWGTGAWTIGVWVYRTGHTDYPAIFGRGDTGTGDIMFRYPTAGDFKIHQWGDIDHSTHPTNEWLLSIASYAGGAGGAFLGWIGNSASLTKSIDTTKTWNITATKFEIGVADTASNRRYDGWLDNFGYWNRVFTDDDATALYNGFVGRNYSTLPASLKSGLVSWYNLNELTGTRLDSHGTYHLTPAADGTGTAAGKV